MLIDFKKHNLSCFLDKMQDKTAKYLPESWLEEILSEDCSTMTWLRGKRSKMGNNF